MSYNSLYIKNIVSNNCGGIGSWRFNALSSPAPGAQTGGFKKKKATRRKCGRRRQRKTRRKQKVY